MAICKPRYIALSTCSLQMLSVIQRQVFDFLGFLWIPILLNFFDIIFIIFGFFGAFQYRSKYIIWYLFWNFMWLAWNIFLICLYLDIGILDHKKNQVLKLDPDSGSWWENGPGCRGILNTTTPVPAWENVTNCLVDYRHVEIFQAGLQCFLSILAISTSLCLIMAYLGNEEAFRQKHSQSPSKKQSLYSIEFSQQFDRKDEYDNDQLSGQVFPKPMTPRRVKRRSVMTRGSSSRQSSNSRRYSARSSTRSSTRRSVQNPVTQLLEQQRQAQVHSDTIGQSLIDSFSSYNSNNMSHQNWSNGHSNPTYQQSSLQSLNEPDEVEDLYINRPASVRSSYSNFHGARYMNHRASQYQHNHATPQVPQKKTNTGKQNMHSMVFLNSGPPAYTSHSQGIMDSETTI